MMLIVSPSAASISSEQMIDNGMDTAMMTRRAPASEKDKDHRRRQASGDDCLTHDAVDCRARTKSDWSAIGVIRRAGGNWARIDGSCARTFAMMSSVEELPVF